MHALLNTSNSKSRDDALNKIINNMNKSTNYVPIAYKYDGSGCSCCLSEYFYLVCKINNEYKIFKYNGYIIHSKDCAIIRCSCNNPFKWKTINPTEEKINDYELENFLENVIAIKNNNILINEYKLFIDQQTENKNICKYNDDSDYNEDFDNKLKNYSYYFK